MPRNTPLCLTLFIAMAVATDAQLFKPRSSPTPRPSPAPAQQLRKASELIQKQAPVKVNQALLKQCTPETVHIVVSIPKQRAYLMLNEQIVIDSPISSGKRGHSSPTGHFTVMEKDPNHHSSLYGDFVDRSGRTLRRSRARRDHLRLSQCPPLCPEGRRFRPGGRGMVETCVR